jgi:serine/threonine protein kinase
VRDAAETELDSAADASELRFEHYTVLKNAEGKPFELGRGAMGITYKAFDVHMQCPVALKIINARLFGDASARHRFIREARAAASVRHPNVASVFHLGEASGNYFYVMEFVDGEPLENLIRRSDKLETDLALEIVNQVATGLTAVEKQHLVHRDIKPSNIMVSFQDGRLGTVKIIDLGLAKGVAEENSLSTLGAFLGTPAYASPEQFAGIGTDTRSDLYSLGITLWEMLTGELPFQGSAAELMYQHQHAAPPTGELRNVPAPIITLLQVLLEKDPSQRFQDPAQLQEALAKVKTAIASNSVLSANELRRGDRIAERLPKLKLRKHSFRWLVAATLGLVSLVVGAFLFYADRGSFSNQRGSGTGASEKSIAVLPFESLSDNKNDSYFADGVQDEILANVARISQLKVISRTSVMQYRADTKRDLRQIANALGVVNILEGTVRRAANRVRITIELVDAPNDRTIWAESYDRDLSDIFAIQSEVAQTVANKLLATLSPEEKKTIETKPTENLEAYDLYLHAKEFIDYAEANPLGNFEKPLLDAINLLEQAVQLDPKFTLAYCAAAEANDNLYIAYDLTPKRRRLGDAAVANALRLQPELPEVHFAYAFHLYRCYREYERARVQLAIAKRGLPNNSKATALTAFMDRRQGKFETAIQELREAIALDPRNPGAIVELANTFYITREFSACEQAYNRSIELAPDDPILRVLKAYYAAFVNTGDSRAFHTALEGLPESMGEDRYVLNWRLVCALNNRHWPEATELVEKMKGGEDGGLFAYGFATVPSRCYLILIARLQGDQVDTNPSFAATRERLNQKVEMSEGDGSARLRSQLAVIDALLGKKEDAILNGRRAVELLPVTRDAVDGPGVLENLAVVYAWTNQPELAFETLEVLAKMPAGIYYGNLKLDPYWEPLRRDPRFEKLLAELAPKD